LSTICGLQAVGSKRKYPGIERTHNRIEAQHIAMQAFYLNSEVKFPNVQNKRSENGRISVSKSPPQLLDS